MIRAQIVGSGPVLCFRVEAVGSAGEFFGDDELIGGGGNRQPRGRRGVFKNRRHGLARLPRAGADVVNLDGEGVVLEVARAAGDDDGVADVGDDGVRPPDLGRFDVVPHHVEGVVGKRKRCGRQHVKEIGVRGTESRDILGGGVGDLDPGVGAVVVGVCRHLIRRPGALGVNEQPGLRLVEPTERRGDGGIPRLGHHRRRHQVDKRQVGEYHFQNVSVNLISSQSHDF